MNDSQTARALEERHLRGAIGAIGAIVAGTQAKTLADAVGRIHGRTVLDVGTRTGRAALLLARGGAKVTAIDESERMMEVARQRADKEGLTVTFQLGDAHALAFSDRSFEVVVGLRLVTHTPRWRECVLELCRVSDQLVILDYASARSLAVLPSVVRRLVRALGLKVELHRVVSDPEVSEVLRKGGFRVRSVHRLFVLPIAVHNAIGSRRLTLAVEHFFGLVGLRTSLGSPVTVVAERLPTPQ